MQALHKNENKKYNIRGADLVDIIIYTRKFSWYLEEKYIGKFRDRRIGIYDSRRIFGRPEERVW